MDGKILIVGGTGMLGRPVTFKLIKDGHNIRLMTHSPDKARLIFGDRVEICVGDVTDIETLAEPIKGCEAVYINLGSQMDPLKYETVEYNGTANIVKTSADAGIKRIAMISGLNAGRDISGYRFLEAKRKAENAVIESGIPYTVFRCCWFFESLPLFIKGGKAIILGKQSNRHSWIAGSDYAGQVSNAFGTDKSLNRIFHIKGIEKLSLADALLKFCEVVFPEAKLSYLPLWLVSIASLFSRKREFSGLIEFMKFFDRNPEPDTKDDSDLILGPALTTLSDWAEEYRKRLIDTK
jgi:NADH dehydrogenase